MRWDLGQTWYRVTKELVNNDKVQTTKNFVEHTGAIMGFQIPLLVSGDGPWVPQSWWYGCVNRRERQQINKYKVKEKQKKAAWADIGMSQADIPVAGST